MNNDVRSIEWLGLLRLLPRYIAPALVAVVMLGEGVVASLSGSLATQSAYNYVLVFVFALLTLKMIAISGWTVFLWDIDRLFFKLDSRIDADATVPEQEPDGSLLGRAREMLNLAMKNVRSKSIDLIERQYWEDINSGGVLAFPQPDITAAIKQIDNKRRDLLTPLTAMVASAMAIGNLPASVVSRLILRYVTPEVKLRLYRRLVLRFLAQLAALFAMTSLCFFISIVAWSRINDHVFTGTSVSATSVLLYQLDLMLRGALFDFMEHTQQSISPITINQGATLFVYYTLMFRMFVSIYVMSSVFKVGRFAFRHWRALLRR